jgi:hypothetical protein
MIHLASFKGVHTGVYGLVNKSIKTLDKGLYSHNEIIIGDPSKEVTAYSSLGSTDGVRKTFLELDLKDWDLAPISWVTEEDIQSFYQTTKDAGYDYTGTGRFAVPFMLREHSVNYFCSEWCGAAIGLMEPWRLTTNTLHSMVRSVEKTYNSRQLKLNLKD